MADLGNSTSLGGISGITTFLLGKTTSQQWAAPNASAEPLEVTFVRDLGGAGVKKIIKDGNVQRSK